MSDAEGLSDRDLLDGDPADYMNTTQLDFFRRKLLAMRDALDRNAARTTAGLKNVESTSDPADRASVEEEHECELYARERDLELAAQVAHALDRIENRSYGFCEDTGDPIGLPRLLAYPTATLTVESQERQDRVRRLRRR